MGIKSGIERIIQIVGIQEILEILSKKLGWSDLQTLMLHVYERKIKCLSAADVVKNYKENRFSTVATVNPRDLIRIDDLLYRLIPDNFLPIELSPVSPVGANASLTLLDPKVSLVTIRNVEVVSDPSMVLALECAKIRAKDRKSKKDGQEVHLATSHRSLRLQMFSKESGFTSHFRAFALASASRDTRGFNSFEIGSLGTHISTWLDFLTHPQLTSHRAMEISVAVSDIRVMEKLLMDGKIERAEVSRRTQDQDFAPFEQYGIELPRVIESTQGIKITYLELETYIREIQFTEKQLVEPLRRKYPNVRFYFDLERCAGVGYYSGLCYKITAKTPEGIEYPLADGGSCDWTRKLLQSKREHLITSGFGSELFCRMFRSVTS